MKMPISYPNPIFEEKMQLMMIIQRLKDCYKAHIIDP
ncbi:MAG: hypothetical protein UZ09_BCD002000672 [Bacteroidetes bacterium OLB9]|nr:MAG: hypothetical protein UZ09_BCD002000672 [Bacteroidetes bacterium OLB9]